MSSFGHTEIEYFGDNNDEVRPLLSKRVKTKKGKNPKYMTYNGVMPFLIIRTSGANLSNTLHG